jgi:hypothetical protein
MSTKLTFIEKAGSFGDAGNWVERSPLDGTLRIWDKSAKVRFAL